MLCAIGDLVEDVAIRVDDPVQLASDTNARIERRRGGSAANVAAAAAEMAGTARFIGQVGDDTIGAALVAELGACGVDVSFVRTGGSTGTIVVLVDAAGERTMLTSRGACLLLDRPDRAWLDGVTTFHVPLYSLFGDPLATTARTMIGWCHEVSIPVSIDLSSVALIERVGVDATTALLDEVRPSVVFANADEAAAMGLGDAALDDIDALVVMKRGPSPATVRDGDRVHVVDAVPMAGEVPDTTGAGDTFAAGFLTAPWRDDVVAACRAGHAAAAAMLAGRTGRTGRTGRAD